MFVPLKIYIKLVKCCLQQILKYLDLIVNSAHVKLFPYWCKKNMSVCPSTKQKNNNAFGLCKRKDVRADLRTERGGEMQ